MAEDSERGSCGSGHMLDTPVHVATKDTADSTDSSCGKELDHERGATCPAAGCGALAQPAAGSGRVLRAAVSDPGPVPDFSRLPPWLGALAAVEAEDDFGGCLYVEAAPEMGSSCSACAELATTGLGSPLAAAGAGAAEALEALESQSAEEPLPEYCKRLELRVEQLCMALRRSESARERDRLAAQEARFAQGETRAQANCCVCLAAPRECAFTPCGHRCICRVCGITAVRLDRRCPICRATVGRLLRIVDP